MFPDFTGTALIDAACDQKGLDPALPLEIRIREALKKLY